MLSILLLVSLPALCLADYDAIKKPHIIFILADDLGWNDVGFHGSSQIPTPNIDALAVSGVILNRYYVSPICTPSRSALMTGKYPIHTGMYELSVYTIFGMQHTVLYAAEARGLPLSEKLMPEYFNELGYHSHIVGKWHLGHFKRVYTPLFRGFRTHLGYWTGHHDYFDHTAIENQSWGLDMRDGLNVAYDLHGKYTTDIITNESVRIIKSHDASNPLFLYVAHAAVHSGNPYNPLPVPDDVVSKMSNITDYNRRKYAAMMVKLDDSVGIIVNQLQRQNMLKDSIIIFSTDNGGPAEGFNLNYASNWPLRGVKNTLWEGGVRGAGFIWSTKLKKQRRVSEQTMHIVDWLPTLLDAIGGDYALANISAKLDGISLWDSLTNNTPSRRKNVLHNIDDIIGNAALTVGEWKVLKGTSYHGTWDNWYGPSGNREMSAYNVNNLYRSLAGMAIASLKMMPGIEEIIKLRSAAMVDCSGKQPYLKKGTSCNLMNTPCLFNVKDDPCELYNLAEKYPNILKEILGELDAYNATTVPPANKPRDSRADPRFWDYTWTNFGDYYIAGKIKK